MEQCERISLRNVETMAMALDSATARLAAERQQRAAPFQFWATSHSFAAAQAGGALGEGSLPGEAIPADDPETATVSDTPSHVRVLQYFLRVLGLRQADALSAPR